ncbi:MAG: hypothetical protein ACK559_39420, partial [bacterium]
MVMIICAEACGPGGASLSHARQRGGAHPNRRTRPARCRRRRLSHVAAPASMVMIICAEACGPGGASLSHARQRGGAHPNRRTRPARCR